MRPLLTLRQYTDDLIIHSHDHAQLVFGLSGALDFEVDGRGSQVIQQSFVVVPSGMHHACGSPNGSRCLVLDVPGEQWIAQSLGDHADASRRLLDNAGRLPLDAGQSQLVSWLANSPVSDPLIAQQGAVLLLASLNNVKPDVMGGRRLPYAALNAHIDQHAAYPLQVADLARIADLSSARLHARFVAECGQTPMDYIRSRRLHMAVGMLRDTAWPIGEIASRVGYSSQSAFAAAVLREFGASPGKLRREANVGTR
ncbi:helix-turn-helix transcriptional regulator [Pseudomonas frederiksbergensis]|uniref:AraC family transcriptional regulator n=1 Tax=Pseudomonas frederiksbergensis TaxID=104087 RepID=A0A423KKT6_9PSED|nr:AraC family transcriptional regulator [Pseudomonas frederiksbergensis]RON54022.1 AraC family transcriptional regulator [Pseudomonas frederiksbergensis]